MITRSDLLKRPEAMLRYPGSVVLEEDGVNEGEGHGFDELDLGAMINLWCCAPAHPLEIFDWYTPQLLALGWIQSSRSEDCNVFVRVLDLISLTIFPPSRRLTWRSNWDDSVSGTIYRIEFHVPPDAADL